MSVIHRLSRPLALACLLAYATNASAQEGVVTRAPLPPPRPFDLDMPAPQNRPVIVVPAAPVAPTGTAQSAQAPQPSRPTAPSSNAGAPEAIEPDEDEGPEWPKLAPGQKAGAEPQFDPNEKPEKPGISTDPGTSIACLPPTLKAILDKIVVKFGAVKVTSTWRPPWRARRGSYHKRCEAMDFRVPGVRPRTVLDYARSLPEVGGNKVYWNGIIHIDTGPRRPW